MMSEATGSGAILPESKNRKCVSSRTDTFTFMVKPCRGPHHLSAVAELRSSGRESALNELEPLSSFCGLSCRLLSKSVHQSDAIETVAFRAHVIRGQAGGR